MRLTPFDLPGRFWRGNLHCHSDRSDGALPPERLLAFYRDAGFDFVALTDHFRPEFAYPLTDTRPWRTSGFTTLLGAELHAPRTTLASEWHIVAVGLPPDFAPPAGGESARQLARRARAAGAFVGMAHPAASLLTEADAASLDAAHAVEVYNALGAREDRADSWHLCDLLLARGRRLGAYAADDAHFGPGDPPAATAWVQVRAASPDPADLLAALRAGHYYSSTGPALHDLHLDDAHAGPEAAITVRCSPAVQVTLTGAAPGLVHRTGEKITECTLRLGRFAAGPFVRVTVVDGAGGRAWSNPIWLDHQPA